MPQYPYFNPRSLYPTRGVQMPGEQIDDNTRVSDVFLPGTESTDEAQAFVERRFLSALVESPAHWNTGVRHHLEVRDLAQVDGESRATVYYVTFSTRAQLRMVSRRTCIWDTAAGPRRLLAEDDPQLLVLGLVAGADADTHRWRSCGQATRERVIHLCDGAGIDLGPSGKKQYWPGRELTPIGDWLPGRFQVKLAHARYAIDQRLARQ